MPLISVNPSLTFEIWAIDFIGPFPIPAKRTGARYIITTVEYVTKWVEAEPVDTYSSEIGAKFIYENIITKFGCPLTLINDKGKHFINKTIKTLTDQFQIDHRRSKTSYKNLKKSKNQGYGGRHFTEIAKILLVNVTDVND